MGFEERKGRLYYYRKIRRDGRVFSEYVGAGQVANLAARLDQIAREERELLRVQRETDRREFAELDQAIINQDTIIQAALTETLTQRGYHKHKGQWRRKRKTLSR